MTVTDPLRALIDQLDADRQRPGPPDEPPGADVAEQVEQYLHPNWRSRPHVVDLSAAPGAGAWLWQAQRSDFPIRTLRVDNLSGYRLVWSMAEPLYIPPYRIGWVAPTGTVDRVRALQVETAGAVGALIITTFEERLPPSDGVDCSGGAGPGIAITGFVNRAAHGATATVNVNAANTSLVGANANRLGLLLTNTDLANDVRVNFDGAAAGSLLAAGMSLPLGAYTGAVWASPVGAAVLVDVTETRI